MGKALFEKLLSLHAKQPWTASRQTELNELLALCASEQKLFLLIDLLTRFRYLTGHDFENNCATVSDKIVSDWKLAPSDTVIVACTRFG